MATLLNPEYKNGTISNSFGNWVTDKNNKQHGGIVLEVEFDDGSKRQKLYNLTESAAPYTTKALQELGWTGKSFADFKTPQLVGAKVSVTIADATDKDGNVRLKEDGTPIREIAFINPPRGYRRATDDELTALAHHFDKYLQPAAGIEESEDSDLPF